MATETKAPDAIAASTNLTGAVTAIDEDPDSPDANWLTATSATAVTDVRVSFPTPTGAPSGAQNFRAQLRKTTGTPTPTVDVMLYQGGTLRTTPLNDTAITSTTGEVVQADWNSTDLVTVTDGSDVECRIVSVVGSTSGTVGATPVWDSTAIIVGSNAQNPTLSPTVPPTINAGDLLLYFVHIHDSTYTPTCSTPSGFTPFAGNPYGTLTLAAYMPRIWLFWKIAAGTEDGTAISVNCTQASTSSTLRGCYAYINRFTATNGFHATAPIEAVAITQDATANTGNNVPCPTVTPTGTNRLGVMCYAVTDDQGSTGDVSPTTESGGDWIMRFRQESTSGGDTTMGIITADLSGGGAISGGSIEYGTSGDYFTNVGFALVPASTAGTATNTVEIGAIEWNVTYTAGTSAIPVMQESYRQRRI